MKQSIERPQGHHPVKTGSGPYGTKKASGRPRDSQEVALPPLKMSNQSQTRIACLWFGRFACLTMGDYLGHSGDSEKTGLACGFDSSNTQKKLGILLNLQLLEALKVSEPKPNPKPYSLHGNHLQEIWLFWLFETNPRTRAFLVRPAASHKNWVIHTTVEEWLRHRQSKSGPAATKKACRRGRQALYRVKGIY